MGDIVKLRTRIALFVTPTMLASGALLTVAPSAASAMAPSVAAVTCTYTTDGNFLTYAGHYSGFTAVPSGARVSNAGKEAQCLLKLRKYNPGTIDGIFGPNSRAAMLRFQKHLNSFPDLHVAEDGLPGPQTWDYLRTELCC